MTASTLTHDRGRGILNTVTLEPNYHSRQRGCPHDILWFSVFNGCRCLHNPMVDNHYLRPPLRQPQSVKLFTATF